MSVRCVRGIVGILLGLSMVMGLAQAVAHAAETYVCWVTSSPDGPKSSSSVIRCRIAGRIVRDFSADRPPPVPLFAAVGTDAAGGCWYRRTWWSGWSLVARHPDGTARLRYDPDGVPGGPILADAILPVCRSEPAEAPPDIEYAWRLVMSLHLDAARITVSPSRPVAGLESFVAVEPSPARSRQIVSPVTGRRIQVRADLQAVVVDWGDGTPRLEHDAGDPALEDLWPSGPLRHVYQTAQPVVISVALPWDVEWRVDSGTWSRLAVPPAVVTTARDVDQIVGRLVSRDFGP